MLKGVIAGHHLSEICRSLPFSYTFLHNGESHCSPFSVKMYDLSFDYLITTIKSHHQVMWLN